MTDYRNINIKNKRATFDYEILETWVAGIVLTGTEIKSIRLGKASMNDCYCYVNGGELWIRGLNISEYYWGTYNNHQPKRDRKLLLQRREIDKITRALQDNGLTVVGLRLFINERGLAKTLIGLARGRKNYDKREYIKTKDAKREISRVMVAAVRQK
ncbi:MAG: SsrA-binding protein SmpB [Rikenellaceae bacterium]|nr:SsrA-binding protein SmpB [Rikenellaceae bacterium]MCL2693270.1 SsrA-binding protein SmpB [Rikenellaceae bacterium]